MAREVRDGTPGHHWPALPFVAVACGLLLLYVLSFLPMMYLMGIADRHHWRWVDEHERVLGAVFYPHLLLMKRNEAYFRVATGAFRLGNPEADIPDFTEWAKRPIP